MGQYNSRHVIKHVTLKIVKNIFPKKLSHDHRKTVFSTNLIFGTTTTFNIITIFENT